MAPVLGIPVRCTEEPWSAVAEADLVVTVTPAREPILRLDWLKRGATVVAVGSDGPDKQELDVEILGSAEKVVVDSRSQCLRLGETHHAVSSGVLSPDGIHGELGDVLLGTRSGREGEEMIVCDLTGVGAQDAAMAGAVWSRVKETAQS
jgi:ornithine cyclodeaminase